jgi:hypothetical protein
MTLNLTKRLPSVGRLFAKSLGRPEQMRGIPIVLLFTLLASCKSTSAAPSCPSKDWLASAVTARQSSFAEIKTIYLQHADLEHKKLPQSARDGVIAWIDNEISKLRAKQEPGDQLWYFREEKCQGCYWYREGLALVRACRVIDEITISDDM